MDSVNNASESNCTDAVNRVKALTSVAEKMGCTLAQVFKTIYPFKKVSAFKVITNSFSCVWPGVSGIKHHRLLLSVQLPQSNFWIF